MRRKRRIDRRTVAVFIDLANMCESDLDWMLRSVRRHGKPVIASAYGNFVNRRFLETAARKLFLKGVRLVHCPGWRNGGGEWKDCADEIMMDDIHQTIAEGLGIGRYIVCTGDGHFVPVVKRIRASGREAIVLAPSDRASRMLEEVADKFLLVPPLRSESLPTDARQPAGNCRKPSPKIQLPDKRNSTSGTNGDSGWRGRTNGPPPLKRPGAVRT